MSCIYKEERSQDTGPHDDPCLACYQYLSIPSVLIPLLHYHSYLSLSLSSLSEGVDAEMRCPLVSIPTPSLFETRAIVVSLSLPLCSHNNKLWMKKEGERWERMPQSLVREFTLSPPSYIHLFRSHIGALHKVSSPLVCCWKWALEPPHAYASAFILLWISLMLWMMTCTRYFYCCYTSKAATFCNVAHPKPYLT